MKINKEQFNSLVAKLDALQTKLNHMTVSHEDCHWCQALLTRMDVLARVVADHDEWAKGRNAIVEERNAAWAARAQQQVEEYDAWRKQQVEAVVGVAETFQKMQETLNFIQHEILVKGKPKPRRKR